MIIPERKNGVIDGFFYINDVKQLAYQIVEYEGHYYYISDFHKVVKNAKVYIEARFLEGLTDSNGNPLKPGHYEFDENGRMILA